MLWRVFQCLFKPYSILRYFSDNLIISDLIAQIYGAPHLHTCVSLVHNTTKAGANLSATHMKVTTTWLTRAAFTNLTNCNVHQENCCTAWKITPSNTNTSFWAKRAHCTCVIVRDAHCTCATIIAQASFLPLFDSLNYTSKIFKLIYLDCYTK